MANFTILTKCTKADLYHVSNFLLWPFFIPPPLPGPVIIQVKTVLNKSEECNVMQDAKYFKLLMLSIGSVCSEDYKVISIQTVTPLMC